MAEFSHHPSAGLDPEDDSSEIDETSAQEVGWGADLPHGRGPETVRRLDDHHMTTAYPRAPHGMINTVNGWQPVNRGGPKSDLNRLMEAARAASTASNLEAASYVPKSFDDPAPASAVVDDNPPKGIMRLPTFWRRAVLLGIIVPGGLALLLSSVVVVFLASLLEGLVEGWKSFCYSLADRGWGRGLKILKASFLLGWRGR